jgi:hypothetical protein
LRPGFEAILRNDDLEAAVKAKWLEVEARKHKAFSAAYQHPREVLTKLANKEISLEDDVVPQVATQALVAALPNTDISYLLDLSIPPNVKIGRKEDFMGTMRALAGLASKTRLFQAGLEAPPPHRCEKVAGAQKQISVAIRDWPCLLFDKGAYLEWNQELSAADLLATLFTMEQFIVALAGAASAYVIAFTKRPYILNTRQLNVVMNALAASGGKFGIVQQTAREPGRTSPPTPRIKKTRAIIKDDSYKEARRKAGAAPRTRPLGEAPLRREEGTKRKYERKAETAKRIEERKVETAKRSEEKKAKKAAKAAVQATRAQRESNQANRDGDVSE